MLYEKLELTGNNDIRCGKCCISTGNKKPLQLSVKSINLTVFLGDLDQCDGNLRQSLINKLIKNKLINTNFTFLF